MIARAAGVSVGPVQSVAENPDTGGGPMPLGYAAARASAVPIEAGTTQIVANVRVVFALS